MFYIINAKEAAKMMDDAINQQYEGLKNTIAQAIIKSAKSGVGSTMVTIPDMALDYTIDELTKLGYYTCIIKKSDVGNEVEISW